ncbi:hypothetical protein [Algihabitans albus]|uniref:hypothetical protein n=1 Tax=Algihabitans albus TaxID=2164067 RepID=UPI000E5D15F0|nr:hypothetical protein [Algihabitans albus]
MPFELPRDAVARLALAKSYPFEAPDGCFLWRATGLAPTLHPISEADFSGRTPVLAHGSNRAPMQLARKFAGQPGLESDIPVTAGWLQESDVVYSAHVTRYGAIASTLRSVPGCRVRIAITWLTEGQLGRMHETEGLNYRYGCLARRFEADSGPRRSLDSLPTYLSDHGSLTRGDGAPLGLAAVRAEGRRHEAISQTTALALVRDTHRPAEDLDSHILSNIDDGVRRSRLIASLRASALAADLTDFEPLSSQGD